jgi:hypothetical protein
MPEEVSRIAQELDARLPDLPPESEVAKAIARDFQDWLNTYQKTIRGRNGYDIASDIVVAIADILKKHGA